MHELSKPRRIAGWILGGLIAFLLVASAVGKLAGAATVAEMMEKWGLADWRVIIGVGELVSALLFLVPRTSVLGTLLLSSYLGGAIVTHMQHDEPFIGPAVILVLLWFTAALRIPELTARIAGSPRP